MIYVGDKVLFSRDLLKRWHGARHTAYVFVGISTGISFTDYLFQSHNGNCRLSLPIKDLDEIIEIRSKQPKKAKIV